MSASVQYDLIFEEVLLARLTLLREFQAKLYLFQVLGKPTGPLLDFFDKYICNADKAAARNLEFFEAQQVQQQKEQDRQFAVATIDKAKELFGDGSAEYRMAVDNASRFVKNEGVAA